MYNFCIYVSDRRKEILICFGQTNPNCDKTYNNRVVFLFMENLDLALPSAIDAIKKNNAKLVVIQLPDGLKPKAKEICDALTDATGADILIWGGSNFGSCDPPDLNSIKADLLIAWGHSKWMPIA